jgi:threonine aldolase
LFDLRSDTVTRPTPAMRAAMADAEVGDDVLGEDPTLNALQERAADLLGKEAALFVPSGTMGNQICLGVLTTPGSEVVAEAESHLLVNEVGGASRLWGVQIRPLVGSRGCMDVAEMERTIRGEDVHYPPTAALSIENTHNYAGGAVLPLEHIDQVAELAQRRGLALHMDGARLFNAQVASGVPASRIVRDVTMVSVCLSKGLGAPVGSIVAGSAEHMLRAHKLRKVLGGGMRQVGVLAAAALIALEEGPGLMAHDHRRAQELAAGLARIPEVIVDLEAVQTNIVMARLPGRAVALEAAIARDGVLAFALDDDRLRFVLHRDVGDDAVPAALEALRRALGSETGSRAT